MDFTNEQQAHVDGLIKKKYAEAFSKAEAKASETIAAAEAKAQGELDKLRAEIDTLKSERGTQTERVRQALLKAEVSQSSALKVEQVMKLIDESVIIGQDGKLAVVDAEGKARFTAEGKPYDVSGFVEEFLDGNPHLAKASRSVGAGSVGAGYITGMRAAKTMKRGDWELMDSAKKNNFIQSGGSLTD